MARRMGKCLTIVSAVALAALTGCSSDAPRPEPDQTAAVIGVLKGSMGFETSSKIFVPPLVGTCVYRVDDEAVQLPRPELPNDSRGRSITAERISPGTHKVEAAISGIAGNCADAKRVTLQFTALAASTYAVIPRASLRCEWIEIWSKGQMVATTVGDQCGSSTKK